jgi:hypothetical protein
MRYESRICGHVLQIKERTPGIKSSIMECDYRKLPITTENIKKIYLTRYGKELKGDRWGQWLTIPPRGQTWIFLNEVRYHKSCNYLEFKFGANEEPHCGRHFLACAFT